MEYRGTQKISPPPHICNRIDDEVLTLSDSISVIFLPQQIENLRILRHQRYIDKARSVPIHIGDDESRVNIMSNLYGINVMV